MIPIKQKPVLIDSDITEVNIKLHENKNFIFKTPRKCLDDISTENAFSISEF